MIPVFLRNLMSLTISGGIIAAAAAIARLASRGRIPGRFMRLVWIAAVLRFIVPVFIPVSVPVRAVPENLPVVRYVYRTPAANAPGHAEGDMNAQVGEAAKKPDIAEIIFAVWGIGFLAVSGVFTASGIRAVRSIKGRPAEDDIRDEVLLIVRKSGVRRPVRVLTGNVRCAVTYGVIFPRVVVPEKIGMNALRISAAHEAGHIRSFDALFKVLSALAVSVHWFNPLAWATLRLSGRDIELACDEGVLRRFGEGKEIVIPRKDYALCLIDAAGAGSPLPSFGGNAVYERIRHIMDRKKITIGTAMAIALVTTVSASVFVRATNVEEKTDDNVTDTVTVPETDIALDTTIVIPSNDTDYEIKVDDGGLEIITGVPESVEPEYGNLPIEKNDTRSPENLPETETHPDGEEPREREFIAPLTTLVMTYGYGDRTTAAGNIVSHDGIDLKADAGTPVLSSVDGIVTDTGYDAALGNYVVISDGAGLETVSAHLSEVSVKSGDAVRAGQETGKVGATGNATGNVLHFEVRVNGGNVDPSPYLGLE